MVDIITQHKNLDLVEIARSMRLKPKTYETYVNAMKIYDRFCKENNLDVGYDSMRIWLEKTKNNSTKEVYLMASKKVLMHYFAHDYRIVPIINELHKIKIAKKDKKVTERKYLKIDEVDKLIEVAPINIGVIIKALFMTGLRISELLKLKFEDVYPVPGQKAYEARVVGKNDKEAVVYFSSALFAEIIETFNGGVYLFQNPGGGIYSREHITRAIRKYSKEIGRDISAHSLRHSRAYDLVHNKGVSIDKVSKFLNHSDIKTTCNFYLHEKPTLTELGVS